jgi:hypothetical protein
MIIKRPICFRPSTACVCLGALIAAGLLAGCAKKPSAEWTRIDSDFRDPPNQYRVVQYSGHEGALLPIAKMREYGIGGVELFLSKHNYLLNEEMKMDTPARRPAGWSWRPIPLLNCGCWPR